VVDLGSAEEGLGWAEVAVADSTEEVVESRLVAEGLEEEVATAGTANMQSCRSTAPLSCKIERR